MKPDDFESRLQRQSLRQLPSDWRRDILAAARETQAPVHPSRIMHHSWLSTLNSQLSTLFWPHPKAWAALAALWIFICILNVSMQESSPKTIALAVAPSPEVIVQLRKQQRMFAELVGAREPAVADQRKSFSPRPRSERAEILMT